MDPAPDPAAVARFAAVWAALEGELDWELLGRHYCWEGGEDFFAPEDREALRDAGLCFAADVVSGLAALSGRGPGRSVYVGAALAELPLLLAEALLLGREVVALALDGPETAELTRALRAVGREQGLALPTVGPGELGALPAGCADHGWLVSVLTDPEAFPALHDRLYGRSGALATGRGSAAEEEPRARALVEAFARCLRAPALVHTTDEELPFVQQACAARGLALVVPERARLSAIVGDPVRACRLEARTSRDS